jgi:hypothetical protein
MRKKSEPMKLTRTLRLIAGLLLLLMLAVGCGVPQIDTPPPSQTLTPEEPSNPTTEPTVETPTPTIEEPTATADVAETATPETPSVPGVTATAPAPAETVASHPLPLDQPWVHAGYRLAAPGVEIDLQDEPTQFPPMGLEVAPDGSRAAYTLNGPDWSGLVIRDLRDGTETPFQGQIVRAKFSPDSRKIAYTVIGQNGPNEWNMVVRDLPDGEPQVIAQGATGPLLWPMAWTPDGILAEAIIWASDAPPQRLLHVNPEDGTSSAIRDTNYLQARAAPNGARIAFVTGVPMMGGPGEAGIVVLDRATGAEQEVVPQQPGAITSFGWSPDGSQLFYATFAFVDFAVVPDALHILSADGSGDRTVAFGDMGIQGTYRDAAWRDATTLLVLTGDAGGTLWLYEMAAGDLSVTEIASWDRILSAQSDPAALARVPHP